MRHPARLLVLAAAALACAGVAARSSMGTANVAQVDGRPCFSVPSQTGTDLRLYGLRVTDVAEEHGGVTGEVWSFRIDDPGLALAPGAAACVAYGATPAGAQEHTAPRPLVRDRLYRVAINARPRTGESSTVAYTARFCLKRNGTATKLVVVGWDADQGRWRDDAC